MPKDLEKVLENNASIDKVYYEEEKKEVFFRQYQINEIYKEYEEAFEVIYEIIEEIKDNDNYFIVIDIC